MAFLKKSIASTVAAAFVLVGCATSSKDISATYVSPMQYQNFDCDQIAAESQRLTARVAQLGGRLDEAASNDKVIMGAGAILFWPALFALGGTKQQEAEYGRLKGEHDALQQTAVTKKCGITTAAKEPAATATTPTSPSENKLPAN
jgi:outer membrane murein-binding lipoprotein Lpp